MQTCARLHLPLQALQFLHSEGRLLKGCLDLSHNALTALPFLPLTPSISALLLSSNHLVMLPAMVFSPLSCLQRLDLSHNRLEELPKGWVMSTGHKH